MQLSQDHLLRALRALAYYRDNMTGHDVIWDRYDEAIKAIEAYRENYSTEED